MPRKPKADASSDEPKTVKPKKSTPGTSKGKASPAAKKTSRVAAAIKKTVKAVEKKVTATAKLATAAKTSTAKKTTSAAGKATEAIKPGAVAGATPKKTVTKEPAPAKTAKKPAPRTAGRASKVPGTKAAPKTVQQPVVVAPKPEDQIAVPVPTDVREHFFHEHRGSEAAVSERELPLEYGDTRIMLMVRDPEWLFAYWEIDDARRAEFRIPRSGPANRLVIRMFNITGRNWPDEEARYVFDTDVPTYANNWYLKLPEPDARWCAELGVLDEKGDYICVARSNFVATPRNSISPHIDSEWMTVEETYRKLYAASGAQGGSSFGRASEELVRQVQRQVRPSLGGEGISSGAFGGASRAAAPEVVDRAGFWLRVDTELIVYGATEPDAKVQVAGQAVTLKPDGSFSLRYALPEGEHAFKVEATSAAGNKRRTVTPVVKRGTK